MRPTLNLAVLIIAVVFAVLISAPAGTAQTTATQSPAGIEGNWQGALDVGSFKLRLVLKVSRMLDGKLHATMDSLDQSANDLVVDTITFQDGSLSFEMKRLVASYVGTLSKDGAFKRTSTADLPEDLPLPLRLFILCVVETLWERSRQAASGAGS